MIAFVRSVTASATAAGSMFRSPSRTSTKTGVAPVWTITFAVAGQVIGVVITSSPGPIPSATSARCSAAVPGGDREHVLRLEVLGHPLLEQRRLGPGRQPAGAERLGDGLDLLLADRRRLEAERVVRRSCDGRSFDERSVCSSAGRARARSSAARGCRRRRATRTGAVGPAPQRPEDRARAAGRRARRAPPRPPRPRRARRPRAAAPRAGRGRRRRPPPTRLCVC